MAKFRVRARAVDMLGRQQIAGIPAALHELFKNAHDAYASRCEADYFRNDHILIVRDDGYGMTITDFQDRWLALGTDSRINANAQHSIHWTGPRNSPRRPIMGEKGIGRLAVGTIAPITLVMTRAVRPTESEGVQFDDLVVALVCWKLFEIPGIDVSDIEIPIRMVGSGHLPSAELLAEMVDDVRRNIQEIVPNLDESDVQYLNSALALAKIDPRVFYSSLNEVLSDEFPATATLRLDGDHFGTHFIMFPTDDILDADIDEGTNAFNNTAIVTAPPLLRTLLGFSNSTTSESEPRLAVQFRDHRIDGTINELIGPINFFSSEEYKGADHHIEGWFDETGHFSGNVSVFKGPATEYELSWSEANGRFDCGPFKISIAYLPGSPWESQLDQDEYQSLAAKLNRLGGLYLYKDDIRVLPYGTTETDFINVERRRTLSASDWFFSYRRMIGLIEITHLRNPLLQEKAGREGLRENRAYRDFRDALEHLFRSLAIDFFRPNSELGVDYNAERDRRKSDYELLRKREKQSRYQKVSFASDLDNLLLRLERGEHTDQCRQIRTEVDRSIIYLGNLPASQIADVAFAKEREFVAQIDQMEKSFALTRPRHLALGRKLEAEADAAERALQSFRDKEVGELRELVALSFSNLRRDHGLSVDKQRRFAEFIIQEGKNSRSEFKQVRERTQAALAEAERVIQSTIRESTSALVNHVEQVSSEAIKQNLDRLSDEDAFRIQRVWEQKLEAALSDQRDMLEGIDTALRALTEAVRLGDGPDRTSIALDRRVNDLTEQVAQYSEFAQSGMAVGVIGHEIGTAITGVRAAIRKLKPWTKSAQELDEIYTSLRAYFDEIDGYLRLFEPLSRRVRRDKSTISGNLMEKYVREVFGTRMSEADIELRVSDSFRNAQAYGYVSTFLSSFINVIDNAIHWIDADSASQRWIALDADGGVFTISNGGPAIPLRVVDRIFDFGLSTKKGGRGMGLAVSREALRKIGYDIKLVSGRSGQAVVFAMPPLESESDE